MEVPAREVVAVVAPGAGSTPEFLASALGPTLAASGMRLESTSGRTGRVESIVEEIEAAVSAALARGAILGMVGGVSVGAHAAALWACTQRPPRGSADGAAPTPQVVLWLPAWTGSATDPHDDGRTTVPPGLTMTRWAAEQVRLRGPEAVLQSLDQDPALRDDWVTTELNRAWPTFGAGELAQVLTEASASDAPDEAELGQIRFPTTVVGMSGDPFHPLEVAMQWARAVPHARLMIMDRSAGDGARQLGRAIR